MCSPQLSLYQPHVSPPVLSCIAEKQVAIRSATYGDLSPPLTCETYMKDDVPMTHVAERLIELRTGRASSSMRVRSVFASNERHNRTQALAVVSNITLYLTAVKSTEVKL